VFMCLITFAWQVHPDFPLIVAANRDEFYHRAAEPARFWAEAPWVLAGKDLQAGGTWMGVTRQGRFAALTNYREPGVPAGELSRGLLVSEFLTSRVEPYHYAEQIAQEGARYSGFNLLVSNGQQLVAVSNRGLAPTVLMPGIHGLSNHLLNTPWPKVEKVKHGLTQILQQAALEKETLFNLMADTQQAADEALPHTGVGLEMERLLSSPFIQSAAYGTRVSTVIFMGQQRSFLTEQTFIKGEPSERSSFAFDITAF
jgi:uncharacterized protein with NRDE domain